MNTTKQDAFIPFEQNCAVIKDFFKRPVVLIVAIIQLLFGSCFLVSYALCNLWLAVFEFRPTFFITLISIALYVVLAIGYILVYVKSRDNNPRSAPTAGFKILLYTSVAKLIMTIISLLFSYDTYDEIMEFAKSSFGDTILSSIIAFIGGMLAVVFFMAVFVASVFMFLFYLMQVRFFANIKKNLTCIMLTYKGAMIFAVFNIFFAFCILPIVPDFFIVSTNSILTLTIALTLVFGVALFVCNAVMALSYRKHIKNTLNNYNTPAEEPIVPAFYAPPVQPPVYPNAPSTQYQTYADLQQQSKTCCPFCKADTSSESIFCETCGRKIK